MWSLWCETVWPELYRQLTENREQEEVKNETKKETLWAKVIRLFKMKEVSA